MGGFVHALGVAAIVGGRLIDGPAWLGVVQIDRCSGVLVEPDAVLTSAHCLESPLERIAVGGESLRVTRCLRHPAHRPGRGAHDLGVCRLAAVARAAPIPLDDGPELAAGEPVTLVGFGLTGALARTSQALRAVETTVATVTPDRIEAGTAQATACRGDSGGPVLVERSGQRRVAAVIHGAAGAMCSGPTEVVAIRDERAWLSQALSVASTAPPLVTRSQFLKWLGLALLVAVAILGGARVVVTKTPFWRGS